MENCWHYRILDADPGLQEASSLTVGDVDGDGRSEIITGGDGALIMYRAEPYERQVIAEGYFTVGLALADVDGDGFPEVYTGIKTSAGIFQILRYWLAGGSSWQSSVVDPQCNGHTHDIIFADVDQDGQVEMVANAAYCDIPGLYIYKAGADPAAAWSKSTVDEGVFSEGISAGSLTGDGRVALVHGADWYRCDGDRPLDGPWRRKTFAPNFREMSRTALVDITGNGRQDIVIAESEYVDGRISWFENRHGESPQRPWLEHKLDTGLVYAHSLEIRRETRPKAQRTEDSVRIFVAEMAAGGWGMPLNFDARLLEYHTSDKGLNWQKDTLYQGAGTHEAVMRDVLGIGTLQVVGKEWGKKYKTAKIHIWQKADSPSPFAGFEHSFIDRDKPGTAIDVVPVDITGNGWKDVACGSWWYANPGPNGDISSEWPRHQIPDGFEALTAYDIDGDGRDELIAVKRTRAFNQPRISQADWYATLTSDLYWLKPSAPQDGEWEAFYIGSGMGDWPHGSEMARILPDGKAALIVGYHSAFKSSHYPELFAVPENCRDIWPKKVLAPVVYGEEFAVADISGSGTGDIVAGSHWLENNGNGTFTPHVMMEGFKPARLKTADINRNGRMDVVMGEEVLDYPNRFIPYSRIVWLEQPVDPRTPWQVHVIDKVRCGHSVGVADLDDDGEVEIIVGEHDPFAPYRSRSRLFVYKKADSEGKTWLRYLIDDRFEHHDGTKIIEVAPGRLGIVSHGWQDNRYLNLWMQADGQE